jgi:hypothetical protein
MRVLLAMLALLTTALVCSADNTISTEYMRQFVENKKLCPSVLTEVAEQSSKICGYDNITNEAYNRWRICVDEIDKNNRLIRAYNLRVRECRRNADESESGSSQPLAKSGTSNSGGAATPDSGTASTKPDPSAGSAKPDLASRLAQSKKKSAGADAMNAEAAAAMKQEADTAIDRQNDDNLKWNEEQVRRNQEKIRADMENRPRPMEPQSRSAAFDRSVCSSIERASDRPEVLCWRRNYRITNSNPGAMCDAEGQTIDGVLYLYCEAGPW